MSLDKIAETIGRALGELGNGVCQLDIQKTTFDEKHGALMESVDLETEFHLYPKSGITRVGEPRREHSLSSIPIKELESAIAGLFTEAIGKPYSVRISEIEVSRSNDGKMKLKVSRVFESTILKENK